MLINRNSNWNVFIASFILLLCSSLGNSQKNAAEYFLLSNTIKEKDTIGLYTKIFTANNKNPDKIYFLLLKGDYYLISDNVKEALNNYSGALELVNDGAKDTVYAFVNYKMGLLHYEHFNYPIALKYFNRAALVYNYAPQNLQQAKLFMLIGNIYLDLSRLDLSVKCYKAGLAFYRKTNDQKKLAAAQNNIAIVYTQKKDFDNAKMYLDSCLEIRMSLLDLHDIGQTYNNYGAMYFKMENYNEALKYYKWSYEKRIAANAPRAGLIESQINIGKAYYRLKDEANAIYWLEQGLNESKMVNNYDLELRAAEHLKGLYFEKKDFNKAYQMQELYFIARDSLYGMDKKNEVENLSLQNQFETKIRQDSLSNAERKRVEGIVAEEKEKRNKIFFYVLLAGILFLLIFVFQLYRSNKSKKKTNAIILQQRDDLNQKQKEIIDSIQYAKRIQESLLPQDSYIDKNLKRLISRKYS